nr:carbon-nitrogen hydrolase family protein [uncultured Pseudomonas sp.]
MKLCAVQLTSIKGDVPANIRRHVACIEQAAGLCATVIVFSELSLTGYEPSLARQAALPLGAVELGPLQAASDRLGIMVAAGLPLPTPNGIQIGMPIFTPHSPPQVYAKQRLHDDELPYFNPGNGSCLVQAGQHRLAPAICYESMFLAHAASAKERGADIYLVSVAKTATGVKEGHAHYARVARELGMIVVMANCVGPADEFIGAGGSAARDSQGRLLGCLDNDREGLLLLDTEAGSASVVPVPTPA